ncbi:hypothetical protein QFZ24_008720 [Streptomyces phaeochromogenes]|nr:hypothetical protein [Streptomyces phaeochromogenes]
MTEWPRSVLCTSLLIPIQFGVFMVPVVSQAKVRP